MNVDLFVVRHSVNLCTIEPKTTEARSWLDDNITDPIWIGTQLAVDFRCLAPIVDALEAEGFDVVFPYGRSS